MVFFRVFILIVFCCWYAPTAEANFFEDNWPNVRARMESLASKESLSRRMVLPCVPSHELIVPSIDLAKDVSLRLAYPTEKYFKECFPADHPLYTVFYREGELIVYYLYNRPGAEDKKEVVLKEWIYTEKPNTPDGSRYAWELKAADGKDHGLRVEPKADGGLTVYGKDQSWRVDPITYWSADGSQGSTEIQLALPDSESRVIARPERPKQSDYAKEIALLNTLSNAGFVRNDKNSLNPIIQFTIPAQLNQYPLLIDPTINYGNWFGARDEFGSDMVMNNVAIEDVSGEIYAGGYTIGYVSLGATMAGTYTTGNFEGFVMEITDGATPTIAWLQWLGAGGYDEVKSLAVNGDELYAGGYSTSSTDSWDTVSTQAGTYNGSQEGWVVEITDAATPTLAWLQWLGGGADDQVFALAVTGDEVYAGGYTSSSTASWDTAAATVGTYTGVQEGWVVEIADAATPTIAWRQWLGAGGNDQVLGLAVTGDEVYAGGYSASTTASWDTVGAAGGTYTGSSEGWVVEISDAATPTLAWRQWLGGGFDDRVSALAVNGDEVYAGGFSAGTDSWDTVAAIGGTHNGNAEGFVVEIADAATPTIAWVQWLGGDGFSPGSTVTALAVNGDEVYAGGYTDFSNSWDTVTTQGGTFVSNQEGFVVEIADAATPTLTWLQWLGSWDSQSVNGLAVTGDEIYVGGFTNDTDTGLWDTATTVVPCNCQGGGALISFVVEIADAATPTLPWLQFTAGRGTQASNIKALAVNSDEIYAGGYSNQFSPTGFATIAGTTAETLYSEGFVMEIADAASPTLSWLQWLGGEAYDQVLAVAVNGDEVYAGGYSLGGTASWDTVAATAGTATGSDEGWVVEIADAATPTLAWRQWLGGGANDEVGALAVTGDEIYAGGYTNSSTASWDTAAAAAGTYTGALEGWVVEIADAATPTLAWRQWLGAGGSERVWALAVTGDEVYVGGSSSSTTASWDTAAAAAGTYSGGIESWVVEIADAATPTLAWRQWLGAGGTDYLTALVVTGDEVYAGGYSESTTASWDTVTAEAGTYAGSAEGWVVEIADAATPTLAWRQWLGGGASDQVNALAVTGDEVYAGGYTFSSTASWDTVAATTGTYSGGLESWVVEIADAATPTLAWQQWLGGTGSDIVHALAINADEIYAAGQMDVATNWEISMPDTYNSTEGFYIEISDDVVASGPNDTMFFDMSF